MSILLSSIVLGLFAAMLFVNAYFRWKVLKVYNYLREHKVYFGTPHILDQRRLEQEILAHYPAHRREIQQFVDNVRFSIKIAALLIVLITTFGIILMYYGR
ncbi:MAG: hypothetical protein HKN87_18445 [Saprospiraceae bacterium]|nr:hypothetical protein [Saprospiraceae bacterium]